MYEMTVDEKWTMFRIIDDVNDFLILLKFLEQICTNIRQYKHNASYGFSDQI